MYPIPGANAALSGLIASGLPTETFAFRGFLPAKAGERRSTLESLQRELRHIAQDTQGSATQVFYETPHRIVEALADVEFVFGPTHRIAVARELTKLHEEFLRGTVSEVRAAIAQRDGLRGEMVLLLAGEPGQTEEAGKESLAEAVRTLMKAEEMDEKDALKRVARERGIGKSEAYREWQRSRNTKR